MAFPVRSRRVFVLIAAAAAVAGAGLAVYSFGQLQAQAYDAAVGMRDGGVSRTPASWLRSSDAHAAVALQASSNVIWAESPALEVLGDAAFVSNGRLHQFGLTQNGPEFIASLEVSGTAKTIAAVRQDGVDASSSRGRIGVTGDTHVTVFQADGIAAPQPLGSSAAISDQLETVDGFLESTPSVAFLTTRESSLIRLWQTDLQVPLRRALVQVASYRTPPARPWIAHGDHWYGFKYGFPIGSSSASIVRHSRAGGQVEELASRHLGNGAYRLLVVDSYAYVWVMTQDPRTRERDDHLAIIDISEDDLPVVAELPPVPMVAHAGELAFGFEDETLVVTSLSDPLRPEIVAQTELHGRGRELQVTGQGAVVLSQRQDMLFLELFAIGSDGTTSRTGRPVAVPGLAVEAVYRAFIPVADAG